MASAVDICNLALAHLGDEANVASIAPPEATSQAELCARFYPIARDTALESHAWSFATRRVALAEVANPLQSWAYAYALPATMLRPLAVLADNTPDDADTHDFVIEAAADGSQVLYTNVEDATLRYLMRVTDTTKYSPLFLTAVSWLLASYLAGPLLKGKTGVAASDAAYRKYAGVLSMAATANATGRKTGEYRDHRAPWIADR